MDQSANQHKQYTCSMHPQIVQDGPGKCPICGMNLVPLKKSEGVLSEPLPHEVHSHKHGPKTPIETASEDDQYYCPMLCEGDKVYPKPGNCPVCGMHLEKEQKLKPKNIEYTCP